VLTLKKFGIFLNSFAAQGDQHSIMDSKKIVTLAEDSEIVI